MAQTPMTEKDLTGAQTFEEKVAKLDTLLQAFPDEGYDTDEPERTSSPSRHKCSAKLQSEIPSPCIGMDCRQRIYRWALRLVGNRDDAEDICQEVCLHCLMGRAKFHGRAKFSTWLYRVMVNTFKDFLRKKSREEEWIEPEMSEKDLWEACEAKSWKRTTTKETQEKVQRALLKLTERHVQLLVLKYVEGYNHAEIAQKLGITEQSAWQSLHRAREAFKQAYEALDRDEATETKARKARKVKKG